MVSEYVHRLYAPASASSRRMCADDFAAARALAAWKARVAGAWPAVSVLHVDSQLAGSGPADATLGGALTLRAEVALGGLHPDDVQVEAVYGAVDDQERLTEVATVPLQVVDTVDGATRYEGEVPLDRTGSFGYTVRVLPRNDLLATPAELGLVACA